MNTENRLMIFISSLIGELADERRAVKEALGAIPLTCPWVFEFTPASTDLLEESYLRKVWECDLFILLLGQSISEPVRQEWQAAVDADKPRLVFLKRCRRSPEAHAFVQTIGVKWAEFASTNDLRRQVQEAVTDELIKGYRRYRLQPRDLSALDEFLEDLGRGVSVVGGDIIQVTIGDNAQNVAAGKGVTQVVGNGNVIGSRSSSHVVKSHETRFHGPVYGPVHAGSGDIRVGSLSYGADEQALARLQTDLIARLDASRYQIVAAIVGQLRAEQVQEVQEMAATLERTRLAQQEVSQLLSNLRPALVEAQEKALLPTPPPGAFTAADIVDAPNLGVAHKLKLTLPIVPFLLGYEGEVQLGSKMSLEMAWEWLKGKLLPS